MAYMRINLLNVVLIYSKCVSAPLQSFRYSTVTTLPAVAHWLCRKLKNWEYSKEKEIKNIVNRYTA